MWPIVAYEASHGQGDVHNVGAKHVNEAEVDFETDDQDVLRAGNTGAIPQYLL